MDKTVLIKVTVNDMAFFVILHLFMSHKQSNLAIGTLPLFDVSTSLSLFLSATCFILEYTHMIFCGSQFYSSTSIVFVEGIVSFHDAISIFSYWHTHPYAVKDFFELFAFYIEAFWLKVYRLTHHLSEKPVSTVREVLCYSHLVCSVFICLVLSFQVAINNSILIVRHELAVISKQQQYGKTPQSSVLFCLQ